MRSRFTFPIVALALTSACADGTPTATDRATIPATASSKRDAPAAAASVTVVMSNLDNPRGLAWGPEGALYVAEAGAAVNRGPCARTPRGLSCYSGTGSISRLWKGEQERVATGLPSIVQVPGDILGPNDVSFQGKGNMYVSIGWGGPPVTREQLGDLGPLFGTLIRVSPNGKWSVVADIAEFENDNNPAGGPFDSNPFGVLAEPGRQFLTDAGGNSLLEVRANGDVSLVAVFPKTVTQADPVPTEVVRGPDGAFYVSQLTGFPFVDGNASVWRVVPGEAPTVYAGGFKTITDLDWGPDGSLYVLQYASAATGFGGPGRLIRVAPGGARTIINGALQNPTGALVGPDGAIYVSNKGNLAGQGEVLRIVP